MNKKHWLISPLIEFLEIVLFIFFFTTEWKENALYLKCTLRHEHIEEREKNKTKKT